MHWKQQNLHTSGNALVDGLHDEADAVIETIDVCRLVLATVELE